MTIDGIRDLINLKHYGQGTNRIKKNRVVREYFPEGEIYHLSAKQEPKKSDRIADNVRGIFTTGSFGTAKIVSAASNMDKEFYLVNTWEECFLVMVTDIYIERRKLPHIVTQKNFTVEHWNFKNCGEVTEF